VVGAKKDITILSESKVFPELNDILLEQNDRFIFMTKIFHSSLKKITFSFDLNN
jgi:hypothetical protein